MKKFKLNKITLEGIGIFLILILCPVYLRYTWIITKNDQVNEILHIARSIEATLPTNDLKALEAKPGDIDKPQYLLIKDILKKVIRVSNRSLCAYIYTEQNGKIYFYADSEPEDAKDISLPGQEYTEADIAFSQPFKDGKELVTGTVTDRWGRWKCVLIPIKDQSTGKTFAVFGMDFSARTWNNRLLYEMAESSLLILLLLLALFFLLRIRARNKSLQLEITERKLADEALKQANDELENLHNNLDQAIFSVDMIHNKMLHVSIAHETLFGYSQEEFFNNPQLWYEIIVPEDKPIIDAGYPVLMSGKNVYHEFRIVHADRQIRWFEAKINPTLDTNGKLIRIDGIASNITDRKRTESELLEKEVQYRNLADSGLALIWTSGTDKLCNYFNQPWLKFTGRTLDQEIGNGWTEGVHPDDFDRCIKTYINAFDNREKFDMEYRLRHVSGDYRWIKDMGTPNYDSSGAFIGYIGHGFDITELKQTVETLRDSEENMRYIVKHDPNAIAVYDRNLHYIAVSDRYLRDYNVKEKDVIGKHHYEVFPEMPQKWKDVHQRCMAGAIEFNDDDYFVRPDGSITYTRWECRPWRRIDGEIGGIITYTEVTTERKKAELLLKEKNEELIQTNDELIKAKDNAEESDRLKSAFLANMSHEIRTPMSGILGFAELLKEPDLTGEERFEYISIIEKSGARMLGIINDIVDISKIESGLMKVNARESNVNEQIEYIYTFFKPEVEGKGMQLFFKNGLLSKEAIINTDREKVYAILINLVKNAIKYSDNGSIELGYEKKGEYLEFFVRDTGIGIPKDRQEAVFNRFVQADIGDKRAYQGAGLGLSISKAYVEMLGGRIWVESEEGKGSVFYFTLPYNDEVEGKDVIQNVVSSEKSDNQIRNLKILIAEDDEISALLLKKAVQLYGKEVLNVRTGVDAVEACLNHSDIDLVLMDIKLLKMDGYEATRKIRQFNTEVIIIAQTAFALNGDQEKAIAAGCNDYISKPINQDLLTALIKKYFQNQ